MAVLLRIAALLAYFVVAHHALRNDNPRMAAVALGLLAIVACANGLVALRLRTWLLALVWGIAAWTLAGSRYAAPLLLLMPSAFLALACSLFARTLLPGRLPLVVRMVSLVDGVAVPELPTDVRAYATAVTRLWAALLAMLVVLNLALALLTTPGGVLERLGIAAPWPLHPEIAAAVDTWGIYLPLAAVMIGEFIYRQRRFPDRYSGPVDFLRRLARVPREAWGGVFR